MVSIAKTVRCVSLLVLAVVAARAQTASGTPARKHSALSRPNILLVTIDTVRADHVGCYGAVNVKTPTIDSLARDGILYERALSQVPLTWPSHVNILTGTYPFHNGVQDFTGQPLAAEFRSVAQAFSEHGYATAATISSFVLNRSWGLARGFAHYDDAFSGNAFLESGVGLVERKAEESVDRSLAWFRGRPAKPFFFWLHLYDPHSAYDPPEPFRSEYRGHLYDGEISFADAQLGRLIAWMKQNRLYDNTAIVLLSDHGESLGEHGEKEHGFFIYNSTIHVPLIIKPVAAGARGRRVSDVVEITAAAPTLLQLAGITDRISKQFDTASLLPKPKPGAAYSETMYPLSSFGWNPLRSLESGDYHYVEAPRPELYNVRSDLGEQHNLIAAQPATAAALKQQLEQRVSLRAAARPPGGTAADDAVTEKLRALGYLAYRSPLSAEALGKPLPDPKDKIRVVESILQASDLLRVGQVDQAEALLKKVQAEDPNLYVIPFMLGEEALDRQQWAEARAQLQRALELNPEFDQAMTALGRALHELGQDAEAETWVRKAIEKNSRNFRAWYELGWIQARTKPAESLLALHKTIEIQPNFALAYREIGMIEFQAQDYDDAARHLQQAVNLGLSKPYLLNYLGIAYSRTGKLQKAVAIYRQALQQKPDLAEAHLNLGFVYERMQQTAQAAEEYATACRLDAKFCNLR